jgi:hypothetical protein
MRKGFGGFASPVSRGAPHGGPFPGAPCLRRRFTPGRRRYHRKCQVHFFGRTGHDIRNRVLHRTIYRGCYVRSLRWPCSSHHFEWVGKSSNWEEPTRHHAGGVAVNTRHPTPRQMNVAGDGDAASIETRRWWRNFRYSSNSLTRRRPEGDSGQKHDTQNAHTVAPSHRWAYAPRPSVVQHLRRATFVAAATHDVVERGLCDCASGILRVGDLLKRNRR